MAKPRIPVTPAIRFLRSHGLPFRPVQYDYEHRGGARQASVSTDTPAHEVIKTLVFETDDGRPLMVLMHGDRDVSVKTLARAIGVKKVTPCATRQAEKLTGYRVGGISPFGCRTVMTVYMESGIMSLGRVLINGGRRGLLLEMDPQAIQEGTNAIAVEAMVPVAA
jgi:Cys-tRNA(Pro) deacylase